MAFPQLLLLRVTLMKLGLEQFVDLLAQGLFQEPAGDATVAAGKSFGFDM